MLTMSMAVSCQSGQTNVSESTTPLVWTSSGNATDTERTTVPDSLPDATEPPDSSTGAPTLSSSFDTSGNSPFPLSVDSTSRALIGANGEPFLVLGDAAWSLMVELDRDGVDHYLEERHRLGFNTILVSLIEHRFSSHAPLNAYGDAPFTTPGDFATPNEAYFQHVDWVIQRMADYGFLVFLSPDYAGWEGGDDGWWKEMVANGTDTLHEYGRFVGQRYAKFDNIVWVEGGDFNPPEKDLEDAVARGISETDPQALQTAHLAPETPPREFWSGADWLDIDNVYTYRPVYDSAIAAYESSSMPFVLMESFYENEHNATTRRLRTQVYHALFTGSTGHIFGNNPIWHFGSGGIFDAPVTWEEALDGPGSRSMAAVALIMKRLEWWKLRPDGDAEFLTDGLDGGDDRAVAALSADRTWGVVYVPTQRTITLDLSTMGETRARLVWYDPTTGEPTRTATVGAATPVVLDTPGRNASGDEDWVLVVEPA
jgi:hypothetical protein